MGFSVLKSIRVICDCTLPTPLFHAIVNCSRPECCHYDSALRHDGIYSNTVFLSAFMAGYGAFLLGTVLRDGSQNYLLMRRSQEVEFLKL